MPLVCRHVLVSGRVQGVGFRWSTREAAQRLGLAGWVRNTPDDKVEVWIEGEATAVGAMLAWLRRGPSAAHVTDVEVGERAASGLTAFDVRR